MPRLVLCRAGLAGGPRPDRATPAPATGRAKVGMPHADARLRERLVGRWVHTHLPGITLYGRRTGR
jgi:hypothetical protein